MGDCESWNAGMQVRNRSMEVKLLVVVKCGACFPTGPDAALIYVQELKKRFNFVFVYIYGRGSPWRPKHNKQQLTTNVILTLNVVLQVL